MIISATYDPADDKIRMSASAKLDPETYQRVKAAGFGWAPKQEVFYAVWGPAREDLALELSGQDELEDEDTSLVDRAEARAERFEGYSERRGAESESARRAVASIADNIPLGQPILVGHHSERHARRDAERIRSGMAKAVRLWKTSTYWTDRAAGALRHAKYKELPAVRARRIKTLEADLRKSERSRKEGVAMLSVWSSETLTRETATRLANVGMGIYHRFPLATYPRDLPASQYEGDMSLWSALKDGIIDEHQAQTIVLDATHASLAHAERWIEHLTNRIAYERAMLGESGGLVGERFKYEVGGRVLRRGKWYPISKVNTRDGKVVSVTVVGHFATTVTLDEVADYRAPEDGAAEKVRAATDKGPMCNYPGPGFVSMTAAEWKALRRWSDAKYTEQHAATATHGRHRTKCKPMPGFQHANVFISDAKRVDPPAPSAPVAPIVIERDGPSDSEVIRERTAQLAERNAAQAVKAAADAPFKAIEQSLKAGVQVVSAPQLFPTPSPLAAQIVEAADIRAGMRVLEPSAGTGAILRAIVDLEMRQGRHGAAARVDAIEINLDLVRALPLHLAERVRCADFLREPPPATVDAAYDRVVMNPPFTHGEDIQHILHAYRFLKPGGRLAALCADGPGRREAFEPLIAAGGGSYQPLPEGSFRSQGTNVRVAMVVLNAPALRGAKLEGEWTDECPDDVAPQALLAR